MVALLIHDTETDKAACSMNVHVGQWNDPETIPGLAHFLEHMLFLGTEKYPDEKEYNSFLNAHGQHIYIFSSSFSLFSSFNRFC